MLKSVFQCRHAFNLRANSFGRQAARVDGGRENASMAQEALQLERAVTAIVQKVYREGVPKLVEMESNVRLRANDLDEISEAVFRDRAVLCL